MNAGVGMSPWGVRSTPARALVWPHAATTQKAKNRSVCRFVLS
jgi:hypothetical protein